MHMYMHMHMYMLHDMYMHMYEARKTRRSGLSTQAHVRVARMGEGVQQITWAHRGRMIPPTSRGQPL